MRTREEYNASRHPLIRYALKSEKSLERIYWKVRSRPCFMRPWFKKNKETIAVLMPLYAFILYYFFIA